MLKEIMKSGIQNSIYQGLMISLSIRRNTVENLVQEITHSCVKITNQDELTLLPLNELNRNNSLLTEEMRLDY